MFLQLHAKNKPNAITKVEREIGRCPATMSTTQGFWLTRGITNPQFKGLKFSQNFGEICLNTFMLCLVVRI